MSDGIAFKLINLSSNSIGDNCCCNSKFSENLPDNAKLTLVESPSLTDMLILIELPLRIAGMDGSRMTGATSFMSTTLMAMLISVDRLGIPESRTTTIRLYTITDS